MEEIDFCWKSIQSKFRRLFLYQTKSISPWRWYIETLSKKTYLNLKLPLSLLLKNLPEKEGIKILSV